MSGGAGEVKVDDKTDEEPKSKTVKTRPIKRTKEEHQPENCCMNVKKICK